MNIFKHLDIPIWYIIIALLLSIFQGIRGIVEHNRNYKDRDQQWNTIEKLFILFIHDFLFRFICSCIGFVSLYLIYHILTSDQTQLQDLSIGTAVLLVFLLIVGIIGAGGQLHYIILTGKWPKVR